MAHFAVNWVDFCIVLLLAVGVLRGRKRGISEELLDVLKWVIVLAACAYFYAPMGEFLAQNTVFSLLSSYVFMYCLVLVIVRLLFAWIRRSTGEKLVSADVFGSAEYYLGMGAGCFRYACIVLVLMAFLNARYYSPEELMANNNMQESNFGSIRFPTWSSLQQEVFQKSFTGQLTREYLSVLLIYPTSPEAKSLDRASIVRARENSVQEMFRRK